MQLIKKITQYTNNKGETKKRVSFYLVVEGLEKPIQIDAHQFGDKGSTFAQLNWVAKYEK